MTTVAAEGEPAAAVTLDSEPTTAAVDGGDAAAGPVASFLATGNMVTPYVKAMEMAWKASVMATAR